MHPVEEQTALVTGATDGLGREVGRELAERGARVLIHGRDREKAERVARSLPGGRAEPVVADFSSLAQVRELARQVPESEGALHLLVNNAGVAGPPRKETEDGHELHLAVNYLSHFLLTLELLPLLERSAPARIVNVASIGQAPIDFGDPMLTRGYDPMRAYCQSKLAQIAFTIELAERLGESGVTVNALHPATLMDTKMVREYFGVPRSSVEEGTEATVRMAIDPDLDGVTGRYFDGLRESRAHRQAYDPEARRALWKLSEYATGPGCRDRGAPS